MNLQLLTKLPKVELHLHLDTSVRPDTIRKYLKREGLPVPEPIENYVIAPAKCKDLLEFLEKIDLALDALQSTEAIEETAYQLVESLALCGHIYAEIRYAPHLNIRKGETNESILDASLRGFERGKKDFGVEVGVILCALRHFTFEQNEPLIQTALTYADRIVGFDFAGDEYQAKLDHRVLFDKIHDAGIPITIHAAEACGPERLQEALDIFHAKRIGHGVRLEENSELLKRVLDLQIPLEMCPTSNVQTNATTSYDTHPADRYLNQGLAVTINTDAMTTTPSNLVKEYEVLIKTFGWGLAEIKKTQETAIENLFLPSQKKSDIRTLFQEKWNDVLTEPGVAGI